MMKRLKLANLYLIGVFIILYAPILYLAFYSFNSADNMTNFDSFTWDWYKEVFQDSRLLIIVLNTLVIALLSAAISTIIGVLGAIGIQAVRKKRIETSLLTLNSILIVSPDVIIGASFLIFFTMLGIQLGFTSVLLSHIAFSVPIVVILVLPKLQEMSLMF